MTEYDEYPVKKRSYYTFKTCIILMWVFWLHVGYSQIPSKAIDSLFIQAKTKILKGNNELQNYGSVSSALSAFDQGIITLENILKEDSLNQPEKIANFLGAATHLKGQTLTKIGDDEQAIRTFEKALAIREKYALMDYIPNTHTDLLIAYRTRSDYKNALKHGQLAETHPALTTSSKAVLFENLADTYKQAGQFDLARKYAKEANQLMIDLDEHARAAICISNIGDTWLLEGKNDKALAIYRDLPARYLHFNANNKDRDYCKLLLGQAQSYAGIGDWDKALVSFHHVQKVMLNDSTDSSPSKLPDGNSFFSDNTLQSALEGKGRCWLKQYQETSNPDNLRKAIQAFLITQQVDDSLRSIQLFDKSKLRITQKSHNRTSMALQAIKLLHQDRTSKGLLDSAFLFMEQSRARVLLHARQKALMQLSLPASIAESLRVLRYDLEAKESHYKRLQEKGASADSLRALLVALQDQRVEIDHIQDQWMDGKRIQLFLQKTRPVRAHAFTSSLPDSSLFILYHWGKEQISVLVKSSRQDSLFFIPNNDITENKIDALVRAIANNNSSLKVINQLAEDLGSILLPEHLQDYSHVIICPDGPLNQLPFEVLRDTSGQYFIQKATISYALSASTIMQGKGSREVRSIFTLAPISWTNPAFFPLNNSMLETESIRALWPTGPSLLGDSADKQTFVHTLHSEPFDIIHFCTHAQSGLSGNSSDSWIALHDGGATSEDEYLLYLDELYGLNLNTELVVLSACETGIGKLAQGEGAMSLARGFMYAGSNSVIASLWKVEHEPNSWIITKFYKYLHDGHTKDEALRKAKLDFMNPAIQDRWEIHPHHWAALTAIGSMEAIVLPKKSKTGFIISGLFILLIGLGLFFRLKKKT